MISSGYIGDYHNTLWEVLLTKLCREWQWVLNTAQVGWTESLEIDIWWDSNGYIWRDCITKTNEKLDDIPTIAILWAGHQYINGVFSHTRNSLMVGWPYPQFNRFDNTQEMNRTSFNGIYNNEPCLIGNMIGFLEFSEEFLDLYGKSWRCYPFQLCWRVWPIPISKILGLHDQSQLQFG